MKNSKSVIIKLRKTEGINKVSTIVFQCWFFLALIIILTTAGFVYGQSQEGDQIRIGFWNIRDFSDSSRDCTEIALIASIAHKMDLLAIAELNDTVVLPKLVKALETIGGDWDRVQTTTKVGNTSHTAEHYGFVFRSDKLRVRGTPRVLSEKTYVIEEDGQSHRFDREPYVSGFETLDGRFDFAVIVVHVTWGDGVAYRKAEIKLLKSYFIEVQDSDTSDNDLFLVGDFNRNVGDSGSLTELLTVDTMIDTVKADTPTKIKANNTYDHILFQTKFVTEYNGASGVYKFDETLFDNDDDKSRLVCSDHRPVWVIIEVPESDDD
jgi:endonuclease/exonuclease/phosphatase family metal-dependent hydrolase